MAILTVAARGQVTLRKEVLQHLGIKSGDKSNLICYRMLKDW